MTTALLFFCPFFCFILLLELSHTSCVTLTYGPCNVFPSFRIRHCTLMFPFGSLTTNSCYYFMRNPFFNSFSTMFSVELPHFSGVTVTQGSCNYFPLSPSRHSTLILSSESLLTYSQDYVVWNATRLCFTHFLGGAVPIFLCNCYARSL